MVKYENHCVGCTDLGMHCMGTSCPNARVEVHYCDKCDCEIAEVYDVYGKELCEDCLKEMFRKDL